MKYVFKVWRRIRGSTHWVGALDLASKGKNEAALIKVTEAERLGVLPVEVTLLKGYLQHATRQHEDAVESFIEAHDLIGKSSGYTKNDKEYLKCYAAIWGVNAAHRLGRQSHLPFNVDFDAFSLREVSKGLKQNFPLRHHPNWEENDIPTNDGLTAYKRGDYAAALKIWKAQAIEGDPDAQHNLGNMYSLGQGVPHDDMEAVKWCRRAAEQGYLPAQYNLGIRYQGGEGLPQDYTEAVKWFRLAAEQGHVSAQYDLGNKYRYGRGVPQDYTEAVKWFRQAAEHGDGAAQFAMGVSYETGEGLAQDDKEAANWYRVSAEQGYAPAQYNLGTMFRQGRGVPRDHTEAVKWIGKAANQGHISAQYALGTMYVKGEGHPKDNVQAQMWFGLAAAQGSKEAQQRKEALAKLMPPEERAEAEKLMAAWEAASTDLEENTT